MKKAFIKSACLACSFILILSACNITNTKNKNDSDIDKVEYLICFEMAGPMLYEHYRFILTPDYRVLAEYIDYNNTIHKFQTQLHHLQLNRMNQYIDEVLTLKEEDISGFTGISDFWFCTINYNEVSANFDYGASNSTAVNILLEQIIGCCDSEKSLKTLENLKPAPSFHREFNYMIETMEEKK